MLKSMKCSGLEKHFSVTHGGALCDGVSANANENIFTLYLKNKILVDARFRHLDQSPEGAFFFYDRLLISEEKQEKPASACSH